MHKTVSINRFKTMAKLLLKNGINIDYQFDWSSDALDGLNYTDTPRLGSGNYNGISGWYFTKANKIDFTNSEKYLIKKLFASKKFKVVSVNDGEMDVDDDRYFYPSISFILNK
jgi:hypothetical protein